jgi:tetratricopeptide (TPR) repeat protein
MSERAPQSESREVSRLLVEKRCEVYSRVAALIMELEEALDEDDGLRTRHLLADVRRCLRSALAFLTADVYAQLERLEELAAGLPEAEGEVPSHLAQELTDRVQLLHVELARSLQLPRLQDLEEIVGLPLRLKRRRAEEARQLEARTRQREVEDRCWQLEAEARELIRAKQYGKAVKSLRRAVRIDPNRAVLRNDLGVVLSLQDKADEAVAEYRAAVSLNERFPAQRTDEWTTSYYNLGVSLRKRSQEQLLRGDVERCAASLAEAQEAFREYTRLSATGPKVQEAHEVIGQISAQLAGFGAHEPGRG